MSWFQFKRPMFPMSRRASLRALLPQTEKIFTISHHAIQSDGMQWVFPIPLERSSMSTQLELHRGQIRLNYKKDGKQNHILISSQGIYSGSECLQSLSFPPSVQPARLEILDLGSHKTIDIDARGRNIPLDQLLPAWFSLGQIAGSGDLFPVERLKEFYFDSFEDLFSTKAPHALQTGYRSIRSYFFQQDGTLLNFLPELPKGLDSGRLRLFSNDLTITLEWSKREVKRIVMQAHEEGIWKLNFPNKCTSMRRRFDHKMQEGPAVAPNTISLKKGEYAFLDQFR